MSFKEKNKHREQRTRKAKQDLSGCWYQWKGRGYRKIVKEAECSVNITYSCMKMEK
jgi:hypothetical protein